MNDSLLVTLTVSQLHEIIKSAVSEALKENNKRPQLEHSKRFVTRAEASNKLRVHPVTLSRWTREGKIRSHSVGSRVYYSITDILNALQPIEA